MTSAGFIAGKLKFKERLTVCATAISFIVIIIALAVSAGYRYEIRKNISELCGDVVLSPGAVDVFNENSHLQSSPDCLKAISELDKVEEIVPVVYRAGIVKVGSEMHGVLFKGTDTTRTNLGVDIPLRLARASGLKAGDAMLCYFVGEKVKARKFTVTGIHDDALELGDNMTVLASNEDLRRLNSWDSTMVSCIEIRLKDKYKNRQESQLAAYEINCIVDKQENGIYASSSADKYSRIFDWLDLIDFNVTVVMILMILVAGFNMVSGLLIILFRNISTIGTLKSLGMSDRNISEIFLRIGAKIALKGILIGNIVALAFCYLQSVTHILKLNPENYFLDFVPVRLNIPALLITDAAAFVVIMLILLIPCLFISKVDPAKTLRAD